MSTAQVALYARVSSEQQAQAQMIDSQVAALRERIERDGARLSPEQTYWMRDTADRHWSARPWSGRATPLRPAR